MDSEINKNKTLERINYILKDSKDIEQIRRIILKSFDGKISLDSLYFYLQNGSNLNPKQINSIINLSNSLIKKYRYDNIINDEKTVSVIIPAYNKKEFLVKTIESILMQSYKNIEIIIIDDASTDGTESLIKEKYSNNKYIRYYKNAKNIDVGKSRLKGYNLCKGDYVIFIDHDDFYTDSDFFKKCISIFNTYDNVSFVSCDSFIYYQLTKKIDINQLNLPFKVNRNDYFFNLQSNEYPKPTSTFPVMYSKNILDRVKLNEMKFLGDSIIYQRALLVGSPIVLDHVIGAYRVHSNNTTYNMHHSTVIGTLNEYISTKQLAINEFSYNKNQIDNWLVMRSNTIINWYLSTCNVTPHSAKILSQWINENHLKLYENVNIKLINKIKNK